MSNIKYDRRSRLNNENLDHLMRLSINGPDELDRLPSANYAKAGVDSGHMNTDDPAKQSKRPRPEEPIEDEDEEIVQVLLKSQRKR